MLPSVSYLHQRLYYNPITGGLIWNNTGNVAGHLANGYLQVFLDNRNFKAHRIAWAMTYGEWPDRQIDHFNQIKTDNRFDNLRLATNTQNSYNRSIRSDNTSGFKGVSKKGNRWKAKLHANGVEHHLGSFLTPEAAYAAYCEASERLHGEFACLV